MRPRRQAKSKFRAASGYRTERVFICLPSVRPWESLVRLFASCLLLFLIFGPGLASDASILPFIEPQNLDLVHQMKFGVFAPSHPNVESTCIEFSTKVPTSIKYIIELSSVPKATFDEHVSNFFSRMGIAGVDLFLYCETDIDVIIDQVRALLLMVVVMLLSSSVLLLLLLL